MTHPERALRPIGFAWQFLWTPVRPQRALASTRPRFPSEARAVVAIGTSITDGSGSTWDGRDAWPTALSFFAALRSLEQLSFAPRPIINSGIASGQMRLSSYHGGPAALERLDADVLRIPGIKHVIVELGSNDLGVMTSTQLQRALAELARRARRQGVRVMLATIPPRSLTGVIERRRRTVNRWIRATAGKRLADFDRALRDPARPSRLLRRYDADGVHPTRAGHIALANAVPLELLR